MAVSTGDYSLDIKRTFLNFAQRFFESQTHLPYTWHPDPRQTNILVVDKNAVALDVIETRPSIVLSRGTFSWAMLSVGQAGYDNRIASPEADMFSDLIRGSVTFSCISKFGLQAEEIASHLFLALSGAKREFRKHGVRKIINIAFGEEQILKGASDIDLTLIPISVQYAMQKDFRLSYDYVALNAVTVDGEHKYQGSDYYVTSSGGNRVRFFTDDCLTATNVAATYIDSVTLNKVTEDPLTQDLSFDSSGKTYKITGNLSWNAPWLSGINVSGTQQLLNASGSLVTGVLTTDADAVESMYTTSGGLGATWSGLIIDSGILT